MLDATINFPDGSTITMKGHGTVNLDGWGQTTSEVIKGTGRFDGIKGTQTSKIKFVEPAEGEAGYPGYGEGTITYTLPFQVNFEDRDENERKAQVEMPGLSINLQNYNGGNDYGYKEVHY